MGGYLGKGFRFIYPPADMEMEGRLDMRIPKYFALGFILALCACSKSKEPSILPQPALKPSLAEPMYSNRKPQEIRSEKPFREYHKYTALIDGRSPIHIELTIQGSAHGLRGFGSYFDSSGIVKSLHANFNDTDHFDFDLWDTTGNRILETIKGRFTDFESFEGTYTRYQADSIRDSVGGIWQKMRIPLETRPCKLVQDLQDMVPVRFDFYSKENDSLSSLKIKEHRAVSYMDSTPSSLGIVMLRIQSGKDSIDSVVNRGIEESVLDFIVGQDSANSTLEMPIPLLVDSLFLRWWVNMQGEYFNDEITCEVEANEKSVLSLKYTNYSYAGGPHPDFQYAYESIDLVTGKRIALDTILLPGYEETLGSLSGLLYCQGDPDIEAPCTIESLVANGFAIRHDGLVFYGNINTYNKEVFIPFRDLAGSIRKSGILGRFEAPSE